MVASNEKIFSLDDVLHVIASLKQKEDKNCEFFCSLNPGSAANNRKVVRLYVNESYNLVYHELYSMAKRR